MRIERVEGVLSGGISPIYRNRPRSIAKQDTKKIHKDVGTYSFAFLFEKATADLAKSLKETGKITYEKIGVVRDYDEIVGTLFDERV